MLAVYEIVLGSVCSTLCVWFLFVLTTARPASGPYRELSPLPLFEKLLLLLNGYRLSHGQVDFALYVARRLGANLTVRFVVRGSDRKTVASSFRYLTDKANQLGVCAEVRTQQGQFKGVLQGLLREHSPDCVLMGHERFSWVSLPPGYTLPTLLMPTQPKARLERLLLPFEDTPAGFEVVEKANALAQYLGAALQPVHLLELPVTPPQGARAWMYANREEVVTDFAAERERLRHRGKNLLFKVRQDFPRLVPELYEASPSAVATGRLLESVARKHETDLIVFANTEIRRVGRQCVRQLATHWPVLTL